MSLILLRYEGRKVREKQNRAKMGFSKEYDFIQPLDAMWEVVPNTDWSFCMADGEALLENQADGEANVYLRPCSGYGDRIEVCLAEGERQGVFQFGFLAGFEMIIVKVGFDCGDVEVVTHEYHKVQPRSRTKISTDFSRLALIREADRLPGLPYEGSKLTVLVDGKEALRIGNIDFLPESHIMFGLDGKGRIGLSSFAIRGPERPRAVEPMDRGDVRTVRREKS